MRRPSGKHFVLWGVPPEGGRAQCILAAYSAAGLRSESKDRAREGWTQLQVVPL